VGPRADLDALEYIYIYIYIYLLGLHDPADQGCTFPRNVIKYLSFDTE
jgi:hypothetical protein